MQDDEEGTALPEDNAFIDDEGVEPASDDESQGGSGNLREINDNLGL